MARLLLAAVAVVVAALVGASWASPTLAVDGGTAISVQAAPWAVYVEVDAGSSAYTCSGSIVGPSEVVTAAHCMYPGSDQPAQPSQVNVTAGVSNVGTPTSTDVPQQVGVSSIRIHPDYQAGTGAIPDDIAVLDLATPLNLNGLTASAVALPSGNLGYFPTPQTVMIAGFGTAGSTVVSDQYLSELTALTDRQGECGQNTHSAIAVYDNAVFSCEAASSGAICSGDSGAGVIASINGKSVLIGVADDSPPGCPTGSHGILANVLAPELLDFIKGSNSPPTAPRLQATTMNTLKYPAPLRIGSTVTCATNTWPTGTELTYTFLNAATHQVLRKAGPKPTYILPPATKGAKLTCDIEVTNPGGAALIQTRTTPAVRA